MRLLEVLKSLFVWKRLSLFRWAHTLGTLGEDLNINDSQVVIGTRLSGERFERKSKSEQDLVFIKITWCL